MVNKAFILAAGLGSRLGKHSENKPKALVQIAGKPMLQTTIETLKKAGISEFVINIHHLGRQVIDFLEEHEHFNVQITISDERDELLDTGGALLKAAKYIRNDETILVHNVDVISDVDFNALYHDHIHKRALASLCVRNRNSSRVLLFNDEMKLVGWKNNSTNEIKWVRKKSDDYNPFAFSGIYMINTEIIDKIAFTGKFSIIDAWLKLAYENNIYGFVDYSDYWFDLGTVEKIKEAENYLKKKNIG